MNSTSTTKRSLVRVASTAVGAVFLLVGILGFVPGITTNSSDLMMAGHHSEAMLLGIFQVSVLHNVVHLLFGVGGLLMGRSVTAATRYLIWGGVVYLVLGLYGTLIGHGSAANFVPVNAADNALHFVLGAMMIGLGWLLGMRHTTKAVTA